MWTALDIYYKHLSYNDYNSMRMFSSSLFNEQHHLPLFILFPYAVLSLSSSPYIPLTSYLLSPRCYEVHHELHFQLISTLFSLKHCKSYSSCHLPSNRRCVWDMHGKYNESKLYSISKLWISLSWWHWQSIKSFWQFVQKVSSYRLN